MKTDKPIVLRIHENDEDIGTVDVVWCPFWGKQPDIEKCEDKGSYYFLNITKDKNE